MKAEGRIQWEKHGTANNVSNTATVSCIDLPNYSRLLWINTQHTNKTPAISQRRRESRLPYKPHRFFLLPGVFISRGRMYFE